MRVSYLKRAISGLLAVVILASGFSFSITPKQALAEGGGGACAGGYAIAIGNYAISLVTGVVSTPIKNNTTISEIPKVAEVAKGTINDCILKPLAKAMIVAIIRNIGSSIVTWVNSGFEGKPLFVTDFEGTLLDAADQTIGHFIEGSDLAFLCGDFSFKIRIALALKYSKPFSQEIRCTLSKVGDNINNFVDTNGNTGWNNFLAVTTEPANNQYGAFLIADSELAQRAAAAVDIKEKRITLSQGFLDFETCEQGQMETPAEVQARINPAPVGDDDDDGYAVPGTFTQQTTYKNSDNIGTAGSVETKTFATTSDKPQCKKSTVSTPGRVVADQLQGELLTGPIQRATADEIDQVIAATLNQLAQKVIQGAGGLLGLSRKSSTAQTSYLANYRNQYYGGEGNPAAPQAGATSPIDDYTVANYDESTALFQNDPSITQINDLSNQAAASSTNQSLEQLNALNAASGNASTTSVTPGSEDTTDTTTTQSAPLSIESQSGTAQSRGFFSETSQLSAGSNASVPRLEVALQSASGQSVPFNWVFSSASIGISQGGQTRNFDPGTAATMAFTNLAVGPSYNSKVIVSGTLQSLPAGASYKIVLTAKDANGATIAAGTIDLTVVGGSSGVQN